MGVEQKKQQMALLYATIKSVGNLSFRPSVAMDQKCMLEILKIHV